MGFPQTAAKVGLITLMAIGSVAMWFGAPLLWIWVASQRSSAAGVNFSSIVMVLVGIPATMFVIGKGLGRLNHVYGEITGTTATVRISAPWMRSLSGDRDEHSPRTVLDVVMVCSVGVALLVFGAWFAFFAEGGGI